jgi:glutamate dehydrogenase/leucine dehydrogenase
MSEGVKMDIPPMSFGDEIGPDKILVLRQPKVGLQAIVVVDNVACGPAIGGVRMAPDVSLQEVFRLARAMTFKNAAAGLPHGGGKSGIIASPAVDQKQKEKLIRTFARMIRDFVEYVPGPDMGTDETSMAWMKDEIDRAVGLPRVLGGIPLDEIGATGFGIAVAGEMAAKAVGLELEGARVAVQGFGSVGKHSARFLVERGARLVAVSDSRGAIQNPKGLDVNALANHKKGGASVNTFPHGQSMEQDALVGVDCDIWIPAARPDVLTEKNVSKLKAKLVLQGANIPATESAEAWMHQHGILNIPDFIANAGGVICAWVEYSGGSERQALAAIEEKVRMNTLEMLERAERRNISPRAAALEMARRRVDEAMTYRRSG